MLHSEPFIDDVVHEVRAQGATRIIGIILSPQFSSFIMNGYRVSLEHAAFQYGYDARDVLIAPPWPVQEQFIELLAGRTQSQLAGLKKIYGDVPVVFTTHSLPERVVSQDPGYLKQLSITTAAVVKQMSQPALEWYA